MKIELMSDSEWDSLVKATYNKPYCFQQQEGCRERGLCHFDVPVEGAEDYDKNTILEDTNYDEMGVSFEAWLNRDPLQPLSGENKSKGNRDLWWNRNFYPHIETVINDLYEKGLLPKGNLAIEIDW